MKVYHYDKDSREYLGASEAFESPLEPGVFHIPAHATKATPPSLSDNEAAVWTEGSWRVVPDYRGQHVCEIDQAGFFVSIKDMTLGEPLTGRLVLAEAPTGIKKPKWVADAWVDGRTLQEAQLEKVTEIKREAGKRIQTKWPDYYQRNAALGLLDQAMTDQVKADIQAVRTATDNIEAVVALLTDVSAVDVYDIETNSAWPVI